MIEFKSPWIVRRVRRVSPKLRLFCVPHAGAGSVIYHDWHAGFSENIEVCAIEPPGRLARPRDECSSDLPTFTEALASEMRPLLDRPFVLFGYSLGALMAFECARVLRRRWKLEPAGLIVAAHRAPHLPYREVAIADAPGPHFLREIERRFGPLDPTLKSDPEVFKAVLKIMRADVTMVESYRYEEDARFTCPIVSIGADRDRTVDVSEIDAWRAHTSGRFRKHVYPGDHFFIRNHAAQLRELIGSELSGLFLSFGRAPHVRAKVV